MSLPMQNNLATLIALFVLLCFYFYFYPWPYKLNIVTSSRKGADVFSIAIHVFYNLF